MSLNEEEFFRELIDELLSGKYNSKQKQNQLKITLAKKYDLKKIVKNPQIIAYTKNKDREKIIEILNVKPVRELSGVTVVALFAKPHACPHGKCIYCPGGVGSVFGDTPQSYTGAEPAALRAIRNNYDPYLQIFNRLEHYCINGHVPDKLELIFMGGTFPSLDKKYRDNFVFNVYKAINDFSDEFIYIENGVKKIDYDKFNDFFEVKQSDFKSIEKQNKLHEKILKLKNKNIQDFKKEIRRNESSNIRSIGLTIETKPDWALEKHCNEMLEYGCTRLEIGVQTLNNDCLKKTNRGHTLEDTKRAFQVAKDMCLKINAHMMLGLPNSNLDIDEKSLVDLFENPDFRPDMLKIYPCLVSKGTPLYNMWEKGLFKAIETEQAAKIIARAYGTFPRYVRVMRVQRDIPTPNIDAGVKNSNLRQYVDVEMRKQNIVPKDIRSREVGLRQIAGEKFGKFKLNVEKYESSKGVDYFIDAVDENDSMIGFIRLRFPYKTNLRSEIDKKTALIRELHVYGIKTPVGGVGEFQHKGWGKKLLKKAEEIAKKEGFKKMCIISGIGVREYYRKQGYRLEGVYMVKKL